MKFNKLRTLLALALGAAAAVAPAARAATAAEGDLFLGFRASSGTGSSKCYVVRIGDALTFKNATAPITINPGMGADLATIFGTDVNSVPLWKSRSNVFWGIAGGTGAFSAIGTDPAKTLYATREQLTPGTQGTPWQRKSDTTQGTTTSKIASLLNAFNSSTNATATNSVSQNTTDANSWASFQPGGTVANAGPAPGVSFAAFNPSIEGSFGNGTAGSVLDLYRMAAATNAGEVNTDGDYLGRFVMNDSGVLTYIPVAALGTSTVQLALATDTVVEDVPSGQIAIVVNRSGDVTSAATVQLSTVDGTAIGGTDFTAISNQVVTFAIGETSKTVNVAILPRTGFQGQRSFTVSLGSPGSGVTLGTTATETVTIDEVQPSTLQFSAAIFNANQSDTSVNVTITRTGGSSAVTVKLSTADDTALAGDDYTGITNQTVNIPASVNSVNVPVTLLAPAGDQPNKQFQVTLSTPSTYASLGTTSTADVRILANDTTAPTVAVTKINNITTLNPTISGSVGGSVTIAGTAADAKGVDKVQVSLNGGAFADATLSGSATSPTWTINVSPTGGASSIMVRAVDAKGNISGTVTRSFTYVVKVALAVNVVGSGSVTGLLTGPSYEVGKSYKLTAKPGNTSTTFDSWSGAGLTSPATELPVLSFVFTPALAASPTVTVTFVNNPYLATAGVSGEYNGLIKAHTGTIASNATNGCITVTQTGTGGAFTGTVKIDGGSFGTTIVKGVFDNSGVAKFGTTRSTTLSIARTNKVPYLLTMSLNLSTKQLTGTLKAAARGGFSEQSDFTADKALTTVTNADLFNKNATTGYYTAAFRAATVRSLDNTVSFASNELPKGSGSATITLTNAGKVSYAGTLSDGKAYTAGGKLTATNKSIFYSQLYNANGGCIGGEVALTVMSGDVSVSGTDFFWFRPYQPVQWYPYGWPEGLLVNLDGSEYNVVPGQSVVPGLPAVGGNGNAQLTFADGLLSAAVVKDVNISTNNVVTNLGSPVDSSFKLSVTAASGVLGGTFTHSDGTKPAFGGILVQKGTYAGGHGWFLTTSPKTIDGLGEGGSFSLLHK